MTLIAKWQCKRPKWEVSNEKSSNYSLYHFKHLSFLLVTLTSCAPTVVQGPEGLQGPVGPQGLVGPHIVIGSKTGVGDAEYVTVWRAEIGESVTILGSGFTPDAIVTITSCEENRYWGEKEVNTCGAFRLKTDIPPRVKADETITVKAWIDLDGDGVLEEDNGELQATYPLRVYRD